MKSQDDSNKLDPGHNKVRKVLRIVGPTLIGPGGDELNDPDAKFCDNCGHNLELNNNGDLNGQLIN